MIAVRSGFCCLVLTALLNLAPAAIHAQSSPGSDAEMHRFVSELIGKMTLEGKIGQMSQIARHAPPLIPHEESIRREQVGSFLFVRDPIEINRLQHIAVDETRLHIPLLFGFDVVHGYLTIYPVPLALAPHGIHESPGGKLPITWPRSVGQEPLYYNPTLSQIPNDRNTMYWDGSNAPLYPFGYGLSYSKISVGGLKLSADRLQRGGTLSAIATLRNVSHCDGDQVVQLYVHQGAGSAARSVRELKGFQRVTVKAGESRTVTIPLNASDLRYWSDATKKWVEGLGNLRCLGR